MMEVEITEYIDEQTGEILGSDVQEVAPWPSQAGSAAHDHQPASSALLTNATRTPRVSVVPL